MMLDSNDVLRIHKFPQLTDPTLVLGFSGWMDGGDVSTGTVEHLIDFLSADLVAEIDPEPFYIYNFPGSMELTALFRPHIEIEDGLLQSMSLPENQFYCVEDANLLLFVGKEPNLYWRTFGDCIFDFAKRAGVQRILFVGSFGGAVPHTRQPRLYAVCSDAKMLSDMQQYDLQKTGYSGPGSFTSYLLSRANAVGLEMASLVVEIPGYLQGPNPMSIEAVTRRLAKIFQLRLDLDALRAASTERELEITSIIEENEELAAKVRELEEDYDNELLEQGIEPDDPR